MGKYYKTLSDDGHYILSVGTSYGGAEITESEYSDTLSIILSKQRSPGKGYKLRTDLTWEEYDLPPEPDPGDEEATAEDLARALEEIL